jgi:dTDP-4-dehydrorhamnose reductase
MILVVGSSGYVGNNIYKELVKEKFDVAGTYFKNKIKGLVYFDICSMELGELKLDKKIQYIVISSASNVNIDNVKKNWKNSYLTDVTKIKTVVNYCSKNNIIPIYISSDGVFDGEKGQYKEIDKKNPINCYGKIKSEVEDYILNSCSKFIILRMGRVFGSDLKDGTIITSTIKKLKENKHELYADDQIFSPLYIGDLCKALIELIKAKHEGIFHLTSIKATSHYKIAKDIQKYFNFNDAKIVPCKINSLNLIEKRPLLVNLDDSKFCSIVKIEHCDIEHYLKIIEKKIK